METYHLPLMCHGRSNEIVSATSLKLGKVLDVGIIFNCCLCNNKLINIYEKGCSADFTGTRVAMETAGAVHLNVPYQSTVCDTQTASLVGPFRSV